MTRLAVALAGLLGAAAPALADTLIDNVKGVTLDGEGRVQRFTGIVVGDDGKVVRLLQPGDPDPLAVPRKKKEREKALAARPSFRIDGQGRIMIPGLIDAHGHVMGLGWQALTLDLSGTRSLAEAQAKIAAYAAANPQQRWLLGRGWNQEQWGLGRFPTAAELDAAVSDRPVWLERVDGHAGWANSAALKAANVGPRTASPAGGKIDGGVFVDAAMELVQKAVPQPLSKERDLAFVKAQEALLKFGITAIADMGTTVDDWHAFRRAGDSGRLQMRIFSYSAGIEPMLAIAGGEPTPWLYADRLRMAGVKLYGDGALGSRGAWLKAPYADKPDTRGLQFLEDAKLRNLITRAAMDGFQVALHAIGDAANAQALDAFAEVGEAYKGDRRWRIEHAQIVDPKDLPRFAQLGVIASMQPVHQTSDRLMAEARLGPARLTGAYAWNSFRTTGARLAFGSDVPVESPDPFAGLAVAISREDAAGEPPGGWRAKERVAREIALAGFTTAAAYASFAEGRVGRLAPGYWADFVLIDRDPMTASPADLRRTQVSETWIAGRKVYSRGR